MWIAIGGTAIVVFITAMTMLAIWLVSDPDDDVHGGDCNGEEEVD